jgi:Pyridoxal-dependent decarboxylase conserved domain.
MNLGYGFNVDAAMAGSVSICPEYRFIHDGIEYADSYVLTHTSFY